MEFKNTGTLTPGQLWFKTTDYYDLMEPILSSPLLLRPAQVLITLHQKWKLPQKKQMPKTAGWIPAALVTFIIKIIIKRSELMKRDSIHEHRARCHQRHF